MTGSHGQRGRMTAAGLAVACSLVFIAGCSSLRGGVSSPMTAAPETAAVTPSFGRGGSDPGDRSPTLTDAPDPTYYKTPNSTPNESPWAIPSCLDRDVILEQLPRGDGLLQKASLIASGVFQGYGEGAWNTPDRERPTTDELLDSDYEVTIVRDLSIAVDEVFRGEPDAVGSVYVRGGSTGCDRVTYEGMPDLTDGATLLFFLEPAPIGASDSTMRPRFLGAWTIGADGQVTTDLGQELTLDDVRLKVNQLSYTGD